MTNISCINPNSISDMRIWHKMRLVDEKDLALKPFWSALRKPLHYRFTLRRLSGWSYSRKWLLDNGFAEDTVLKDFLTEKERKMLCYLKHKFQNMSENGHPLFEESELREGIAIIDEMLQMAELARTA